MAVLTPTILLLTARETIFKLLHNNLEKYIKSELNHKMS